MSDVLISYAAEDGAFAEGLARALSADGCSVERQSDGEPTPESEAPDEAPPRQAKCVIVVWSRSGVESERLCATATDASVLGKLIPVLIDEVKIPQAFRHVPAARLFPYDPLEPQTGFAKLRAAVAAARAGDPAHIAIDPWGSNAAPPAPAVTMGAGRMLGILALMAIVAVVSFVVTRIAIEAALPPSVATVPSPLARLPPIPPRDVPLPPLELAGSAASRGLIPVQSSFDALKVTAMHHAEDRNGVVRLRFLNLSKKVEVDVVISRASDGAVLFTSRRHERNESSEMVVALSDVAGQRIRINRWYATARGTLVRATDGHDAYITLPARGDVDLSITVLD